MWRELRPAIVVLVALTAITGLVYPLAVTGIAQPVFPSQAQGSLIERNGHTVIPRSLDRVSPATNIFTGAHRPRPLPIRTTRARPSPRRTTPQIPEDRISLLPTRPSSTACKATSTKLKQEIPTTPVPADLVTTSASGLDPDISPEAALFQVPRVAKARNLTENRVRQIVIDHIEDRFIGVLGDPRVNVLKLNLALDDLSAG